MSLVRIQSLLVVPQTQYHTSYMMEPLGEPWFSVVLVGFAAAPLAVCFTTGWNFERSGVGEGLVTSLWAGLSGVVLFLLLPLTKKGAGASCLLGACLLVGVQVCSWHAGFSQTVLAW